MREVLSTLTELDAFVIRGGGVAVMRATWAARTVVHRRDLPPRPKRAGRTKAEEIAEVMMAIDAKPCDWMPGGPLPADSYALRYDLGLLVPELPRTIDVDVIVR